MKISKKTAAILGLVAVTVLTALWFGFRSGFFEKEEEPVPYTQLPGLSGTPVYASAQLVRLRAGADPLVLSEITSEQDPALLAGLSKILSSYGFLADDPDSVSADAVRLSFAYGENAAAALEIRSDSSVTLYGSGKSASYRAVARQGVKESLYSALGALLTQAET